MNLRKYDTAEQAVAIRTEACRLAVQMMDVAAFEEHGASRLMALCVFFESYIAHGSSWTEKRMKLMGDSEVVALSVVQGGKQ